MLECYTAVDVETPNRNNDSLCSIGVVHMEYGVPVYKREFLVDPEAHFDDFNIGIHGITPAMVKDAPLFPEVWQEIGHYFNGVVAAHNATFDLAVICKMLSRHDIPIPDIRYACTLLKARRHIPRELCGSHKLNDLCAWLNVPLEHHHNALDDALGCALILESLTDTYGCDACDIRRYEYAGVVETVEGPVRARSLAALRCLLESNDCGPLTGKYHEALEDWTRKNDSLMRDADIRACLNAVQGALEKGSMDEGERARLLLATCTREAS